MSEFSPGFEVDPSGAVQRLLRAEGMDLQPDPAALMALADYLDVPQLKEPRLLLLDPQEEPAVGIPTVRPDHYAYLPSQRNSNDLVVRLGNRKYITEALFTQSIARALVDRQRAAENQIGKVVAGGLIGVGLVLGVTSEATVRERLISGVGLAMASVGALLLAYYTNRGRAPLPELQDVAPPIRLIADVSGD